MPKISNFEHTRGRFALATPLTCIALSVTLMACSSTPGKPDPVTDAMPSQDEIFDEAIHWSRSSAEHRAIYEQTYRLAGERIAMISEGLKPGTWAVSLDADETLIDNSLYQVEIAARGESFAPESWNAWIERRSAPAMPGAVEFTQLVKSLGGTVGVVTNRRHYQCAPTADNLNEVGIAWDVVLCRIEDGEKEPRFDALRDGTAGDWLDVQFKDEAISEPLTILMWIGDNIGDFPGTDQGIRQSKTVPDDFGRRFFVLPNPMYGSWESNPKN